MRSKRKNQMLGDAPHFCEKHWHQQPKTSKRGC